MPDLQNKQVLKIGPHIFESVTVDSAKQRNIFFWNRHNSYSGYSNTGLVKYSTCESAFHRWMAVIMNLRLQCDITQ